MNLFERTFDVLLEADVNAPDKAAPAPAPANDRQAMAQSLDSAKPEDFDVQQPGREKLVDHIKTEQSQKLTGWIGKIDEFIKFLNSTEPSSMQVQLHSAPCDSVFEDISRSEKKKIARLAAELSSLSESLKGYLISSNDR
jgi:hypothetical protein